MEKEKKKGNRKRVNFLKVKKTPFSNDFNGQTRSLVLRIHLVAI